MKEIPSDLPAGFISGEIPATKAHSVKHTGPYTYVGNAWSAQYARRRAKKFKSNRRIHPMEIYLNSPMDTDPKELQSEILMPIK